MSATIQKWGNSLAVRIPKAFADEIGLVDGARVDLHIVDGRLVLEPVKRPRISLEVLLAQVTDDNLHCEISTGDATGNEVW